MLFWWYACSLARAGFLAELKTLVELFSYTVPSSAQQQSNLISSANFGRCCYADHMPGHVEACKADAWSIVDHASHGMRSSVACDKNADKNAAEFYATNLNHVMNTWKYERLPFKGEQTQPDCKWTEKECDTHLAPGTCVFVSEASGNRDHTGRFGSVKSNDDGVYQVKLLKAQERWSPGEVEEVTLARENLLQVLSDAAAISRNGIQPG